MGKASGLMAILNAVGAAISFWVFGFVALDVRHSYTLYGAVVAISVLMTITVARETQLLRPPPNVLTELISSFYVSRRTHGDFFWVFWIRHRWEV